MKKMLNELVRYGKFAFALAFALCCFNASAATITPAEHFAKKVDFTISGYSGTSTLANFPVLVKLSTSLVQNFDYSDCGTDGANIRFIDADNNLLPFEIDTWNPSGESFIWVSVPSLSGTSTKITMCYGANGSTCPSASGNVWTLANYKSVWHMNIANDETLDSVASYSATVQNPSTVENAYCGAGTGIVGGDYYCIDNYVKKAHGLKSTAYQGFASSVCTYSAWVRQVGGVCEEQGTPDLTNYPNIQWVTWGNSGIIWNTQEGDGAVKQGAGIELGLEGSSSASALGISDDNGKSAKFNLSNGVTTLHDKAWHYVIVRYDGTQRTLWVDNNIQPNFTKTGTHSAPTTGTMFMGERQSIGESFNVWTGDLDEMRFRGEASSEDWLTAEYANVTAPNFLSNGGAVGFGKTAKKVTFTVGNLVTADVSDVPVLVKLSAGSPSGFSYSDCAGDGSDIRFTDASGNPIPFEIDSWNTAGTSTIWVKPSAVTSGTTFTMNYGSTPTTVNDPSAVWSGYTGVWHFETLDTTSPVAANSQGKYANSTATAGIDGNLSSVSVSGTDGKFGKSFKATTVAITGSNYNTTGGGVWVSDSGTSSPLDADGVFTISGWFKFDGTAYYWNKLFMKREKADTGTGGFSSQMNSNTSQVQVKGAISNTANSFSVGGNENPMSDWVYITLVYSNTTLKCYANGALKNNFTVIKASDNDSALTFGNVSSIENGGTPDGPWNGRIDEVRYSKVAMTDNQIAAEYAAMANPSFLSAGEVEDVDEPAAGTVTWTSSGISAGPAVFSTEGELVYAYYAGDNSSASSITVNDITFTKKTYDEINSLFSADPTFDGYKTNDEKEGYNDDFGTMLNGSWRRQQDECFVDVSITLTLPNLVAGESYRVQLLAHRDNNVANDNTLRAGDAEAVVYAHSGTTKPTGGYGAVLTGTFVASGPSQDITLIYHPGAASKLPLNAIQVRKLSSAPAPLTGDYFVSTTGSDFNAGTSREEPFATIVAAVNAVGSASDKTIVVLEGTHEIATTISLDNGTKLIGEGMDKTIIKPASGQNIRCVELNGGAKLEGVTLTGGNLNSDAGAGVWIKNGTVSWCCISNNTATAASVSGAGVSFTSGQGSIDHSIVVDNKLTGASWGAGIGGLTLTGAVVIDSCLVYNNDDQAGSGGGIGFDQLGKALTIRNCTVVKNKGKYNSGGLYYNQATVDVLLLNNIVVGNTKDGSVGNMMNGSYLDSASRNCLFETDTEAGYVTGSSYSSDLSAIFVDASNGNYKLASSSPAKGAGLAESGSGVDLDNKAFAATPSIGCYEYDSVVRYSTDGGLAWTDVADFDAAFNAVKGQTSDAIIEVCADGVFITSTTLSGAQCNITLRSKGDVRTLTRLLTAADKKWELTSGKNVTLSNIVLNAGASVVSGFFYVPAEAKLYLAPGSVLTSSATSAVQSEAVRVSGGELHIDGGVIRGWNISGNPVIYPSDAGKVYLTAGGIENCSQAGTNWNCPLAIGGDSATSGNAYFYMSGGFIRNNTLSTSGLIRFDSNAFIELSGGEIVNNCCSSESGVGAIYHTVVKLSGNPVVSGNLSGSTPMNINVTGNSNLSPNNFLMQTGNLTSGANIGVYSTDKFSSGSSFGTATAGLTGAGYIRNDRDESLFGSVDGTSLKWAAASLFYIDSQGYSSWTAAMSAASDGDRVTLGGDASISASAQTDKSVTIDLAGHTLSVTSGWWDKSITVVDTGTPAGSGRIVFPDGGLNVNEAHLDFSSLTSDQISGKLSLQTGVTEVKFPSDMSYEAALQHISYSTIPNYDPEGTTLVIRDVTYTWDGSAWVAQTTPEGDWFVSPSGDDNNNDGKSADTAFKTIAKAVTQATDGDTICVLAGTYNISATIEVNKGITIKGEGWDKTIVDGTSNAALFRLFKLDAPNAKLEGMKLTGAKANSRGAAVHMTDGTISWCYICENSCTAGSGYWGGAVSILKGTIDHSVITNNTSTISGAAIGSRQGTGDILIDTCLVYGNSMSSEYNGSGGIDLDSMTSGTVKIRNCTIVNNASTGDYPAGVRVTGAGSVVLINDIISGNQRTYNGTTGELNLAVTTEMLDRTNSRNCIITGTKDTDSNYYRDAGAVSQISGSKNVAPTFVGEASGDYHLSSDSSAIAAGVTYTGIGKDLDSKDFVNPPSIGCYEYDGVAPTTYAVTWSGAANATVSAKVDGAAITSGASVEDGKEVVFTVTPNSGYEFATASDGWTKSGANLTKTVTVNGAAVAVVIPGATAIPVVATPAFSPAAGTITEATDVTITCATDGATIHYTTDDTTPTASSPTYSSAISIPAETTTLKAIAVKDGMAASAVATATYTYEPPQPTDPAIGSLVITPNGSTAWFSLSGITLGTDSGAVPATLYSVDFAVKNSAGSTIKNGTKLTGQTSSSCFFDVADIPDGTYTGYVTITTDKGKTATKDAEFTIDTSSEEPTIPLEWTASPMTGSGDIRTDGALIYAYMRGNSSKTTYTINTVAFTGLGDSSPFADPDHPELHPELAYLEYGSISRDSNQTISSLTDPYEMMLGLNWRGGPGKVDLVLKNLVAGNTYLVQIVIKSTDSLGGNGNGNNEDGASTTAPDGIATIWSSGSGWENGGSLVGVFEATGTTKTFTLTTTERTILNAIQVRDVSPVETVTPGTSASDTRNKIQAAIDRAAPTHREVKLSEGTFLIDTQLYVTNGVTLSGQGWENTIIKQTTSGNDSRCAKVSGGATLRDVTVTGGRMTGENYSFGGGVWLDDATVSWCCISNNTITSANTKYGGGIGIFQSKGKIDHCIIVDNTASTSTGDDSVGGGIGIKQPYGEIIVDSCLICDNSAYYTGTNGGKGGGIGVDQNSSKNPVTIRNTTIVGNQAGNGGTAVSRGGAVWTSADPSSAVTLTNCIIADNTTVNADTTIEMGSTAGIDYCIFDSAADKNGEHSAVASSESIFVDAKNGNYHLGDASPAIGTGATYEGLEGNVDLDGDAFGVPPSIGCYEYKGTGLVPSGDPNQIQAAIDVVAPVHGTVHLGEGLFEITTQLMVTNGVTLTGKGWEKTILKYVGTKNQATSRVATLRGGATLSHVTVTGGSVATSNAAVGGGVAIDGYDEGATISWCCITNNYNTYGFGSGIGVSKAENVRIDHTIVSGNTGYAGICVLGSLNSNTEHKMYVEIDTCLVAGNTAGSNCAGIRIGNKDTTSDSGGDAGVVTAIIRNTTVAGNQVTGTGTAGGVYVSQQKTTLVNCIFSDNTIVSGQDPNVVIADHVKDAVVAMTANCYFGGTTTAFGYAPKSESVDGAIAFVNAANDYYHLTANSPAIAAGSTIAADRVDLDNVAFVAPPSVGCYEYESSVPAPKFTPASGTKFQTQLEVRINGQGTVYYTTDGTVPTEGSSTYSSARTISDTTKFMARAYLNGVWSAVASATYVKAAPDAGDYYVSITGSDFADGLTPETAFRTIERAVEVANEGQKVTILPGTFEIDETIVINKAITVTGSGWDKTIIKPTTGKKIRLVELDGGAKLEGVTLTGVDKISVDGAAAWVKNGTISWCCITNNTSTSNSGGGAVVSFQGGQGTIDHCVVAKNTGGNNGCCGSVGATDVSGPIVIDTCLIYGNYASWGGGVGFKGTDCTSDVTIRNCTIADNTAGVGGISIHDCPNAKFTIINTISVGNALNNLYVSSNTSNLVSTQNCFIDGEAQFTNATDGDYHPSAGWEDVIGKGVTYAGIGDTLDGMPFNDPPSIGCYEPSIGFGKVTFAYPAKHEATATVQLIGLSDGATTANVTFQYGPDSEHLCEPAIVVTNGVGIKTDIVATMSGLNANCEYAYLFKAVDDKGETTTRSGIFTTDDWDTLQFSTVKANPTSNSADVSVTIMKLGRGATNATVYVQWGTNYNDLCQAVRISTTAQQKQTLTYTIPGLKNDTDYVVRFSGENDVGDTATRDGAFKTLEKEKLALGEPKVSNLGQTTADIAVTVPTLGEGANSATVTLKWWIDGTTDTNSVVMSSAAVRGSSLSQQITGLTANKLYLYEIEAVNDLPSPETETKSVTGGFTTDDPNIGADDYHDSYLTVDANHVVTYDADSAGNPSTLEPGSPYVVVAKEGYGVSHPAGGKTYWFRNEYDYQYNCSARIGDTYYLLLSDAVAAASSGATIELLRNNYAIGVTMQISRKLTIEGNGYAVKVAAPFLDTTGYVNPKCTATPKTVFKIGTGGDVVINDMLVMGGGEQLATGGAGSNSANDPAIVVTDTGILEMDHVTVKRSQGGLWIGAQAKVHLNACNLVKNARFCGGGLYSLGVLVMENSSLSENRSLSSGGGGAAAENQGLLVMNNCVICNNGSTEYGGAINNLKGTAVVYMMNMTMAGNFTSNKSDNGGGIGLHQAPGALYMVNSILCNNYHYDTTSGQGEITDSDIYALTDVGNVNNIYYSVYGVAGGSDVITFHDCWKVVAADEDVFKDYTKFSRTYEQAKTTGVPIPGPLFDYAPSNEDARYAPLTENGSKADVDNEGVYTYFDASAWRSAEGNSDVSWLKMAYREDDDTTLTALGNCAMADEEDLVTTYYETAFDPTISDREPGVVGASGFGTHKKTYTLVLLENPVNGGVSDNLDLYGKSYNQGAEVTVVATPDAKCTFLGWFDAKDATEPVSTKLAYKFVMDSNKSLLARFSEPSETVIFYEVKCEQTEGDHDLFQIEITKDWLGKVFPTICPGGEVTTTEVKALVEAELNKPDSANGLNHVWQNYVLGQMSPGDPDGRIWIRGAQYYETDKLTFNIQEFAETKDCGFLVRYRLAKKDITKGETEFNRSGEYKNNTVGKFNDPVSEDIQYCVIDMIFIPTTAGKNNKLKLDTSFEYVTTVNTAGVMKVNSDKRVEILASPFVGFSPTNNPTIKATDYVKASCLNKDDVLYIYDRAHSNYLAWAVQDGQWAQKDTYQIINGVVYKDDDPADIANTNSLPRGMGAWLERSNTKSPIYLYGQVDPSPVTTTLEPGFNLVGNPYPYEFDASQLPAPMEKSGSQYVGDSEDLDDDHIVIPTGGAPLNCEYANGSWGSYVTKVVEIKDAQGNPVINKKTGKPMTGVVTEWSTDGMTLPIGHGFWYYNSNPTSYELVWPKVKSEEAE